MKRVLVVVSILCTNSHILTKATTESSPLISLGSRHSTVLNRPRIVPLYIHRNRQVVTTRTTPQTSNDNRIHVSERYTLPDHVFLNQE